MSEFLLELQRNGAYLKVTAVDPVSGEEVSTLGPATDPEAVKRLAVQKLKNRLEALKPPPLNRGRGGIIC
ncbi:DUF6898 family protein [Asticcacaulis excentricus]|uniref:DUF6898 domain-containing protein n=1 Tax=Asticcacaulis excentricus TaxID=78587 RepID=A0A3G9G4G5_9CAUL|nr:hypothetical protein [Asticcacaulis excentricus]BBF82222.1 hypothetical protein EM6_2854 [Asticcacaulis excentricus]